MEEELGGVCVSEVTWRSWWGEQVCVEGRSWGDEGSKDALLFHSAFGGLLRKKLPGRSSYGRKDYGVGTGHDKLRPDLLQWYMANDPLTFSGFEETQWYLCEKKEKPLPLTGAEKGHNRLILSPHRLYCGITCSSLEPCAKQKAVWGSEKCNLLEICLNDFRNTFLRKHEKLYMPSSLGYIKLLNSV